MHLRIVDFAKRLNKFVPVAQVLRDIVAKACHYSTVVNFHLPIFLEGDMLS